MLGHVARSQSSPLPPHLVRDFGRYSNDWLFGCVALRWIRESFCFSCQLLHLFCTFYSFTPNFSLRRDRSILILGERCIDSRLLDVFWGRSSETTFLLLRLVGKFSVLQWISGGLKTICWFSQSFRAALHLTSGKNLSFWAVLQLFSCMFRGWCDGICYASFFLFRGCKMFLGGCIVSLGRTFGLPDCF